MSMKNLQLVSRCAALAAVMGAMALTGHAQQNGLNPASSSLLLASARAVPGTADTGPGESSSAAVSALEPGEALAFESGTGTQPPPRRRYGRPTYHDGNANADGSRKYAFSLAGGLTLPTGDKSNYLTTSWSAQGEFGRNFNQRFGLLLRIAYDRFGMTAATISNQSNRYFGDPTNQNGLNANSHIWSISIDPVVNLLSDGSVGAYVTGGVGFYHKVANFTLPQTGESCSYYYGCYYFTADTNVDHYMSNAPGFDGGFGLTYKLSRFSNERLFVEARYVYMKNKFTPGITAATQTTYTGDNFFPENSQTTSYLPVKFGIRW